MATVTSVNLSAKKTVRKTPGTSGTLIAGRGFEGDAHAGDWHRRGESAREGVDREDAGQGSGCRRGDFAENITTTGIDLVSLPVGTRVRVGDTLLQVSQIGKECHTKCAIYYQAGDCVMPKEGIFATVLEGGRVSAGDEIVIVGEGD